MRDEIARLYTGIAEAHLGGFLGVVADGDLPVLVHCTAGKDRTGIAIALLLELLGVPRGVGRMRALFACGAGSSGKASVGRWGVCRGVRHG